jgi:hypothetical protein
MEAVVQFVGVPAQVIAGRMIASFKDYPPRQKPASFNLDQVMNDLIEGGADK